MALSQTDLQALRTEIDTDPLALGLAAMGDVEVAETLNTTQQADAVQRDVVESREIVAAIVPGDWAGLSDAEKDRIHLIVSAGDVDVRAQNVRDAFAGAFGSGTTTRSNLVDLQTRDGSRTEELFGGGALLTPSDVANARRL